jgi:16S rRNA (guanine1516-N2)-methyltransferase
MNSPAAISVSSTINSARILQKAAGLAKNLGLTFIPSIVERTTEIVLAYTPEGLKLLHAPLGSAKTTCLHYVDFIHGKHGFRLAHDCSTKQPLARAIGIKPGYRPTVLDTTAGLGGDSFVLASLGCQVTMCERSPLVAALLADGLARALQDSTTAGIVGNRMQLIVGDARHYLQQNCADFAAIYLDPMYPHRRKSALNSLTMRTLRTIVGDDQDSGALLESALVRAQNRVVVKRPRLAPTLTEAVPSHVIAMKNSRFDIYLTFNT